MVAEAPMGIVDGVAVAWVDVVIRVMFAECYYVADLLSNITMVFCRATCDDLRSFSVPWKDTCIAAPSITSMTALCVGIAADLWYSSQRRFYASTIFCRAREGRR
jgi:hypothetical protein